MVARGMVSLDFRLERCSNPTTTPTGNIDSKEHFNGRFRRKRGDH